MSRALSVLLLLAFVLLARGASAHEIGVSSGSYTLTTTEATAVLTASLTLSQRELLVLVPELDPQHDGAISGEDLDHARDALRREVVDRVRVRGDGTPCAGTLDGARVTENDGLAIDAQFTCAPRPSNVVVEVALLTVLSHGHRHFAHVISDGTAFDVTLFNGSATFELTPGRPHVEGKNETTSTWSLFRMGIEHILTGYDHLVFLFGLVLVGGRVRALVAVVSAFTLPCSESGRRARASSSPRSRSPSPTSAWRTSS